MIHQLKVEHFGAITSATIDIRKYNIFIGETSSGKSTIAKLLAIVMSRSFLELKNGDFQGFVKLLERYNIDFELNGSTLIQYRNGEYHAELSQGEFHSNFPVIESINNNQTPFNGLDVEDELDDNVIQLVNELEVISKESVEIKENSGQEDFERIRSYFKTIQTVFARLPDMLNMLLNIYLTPTYIPAERLLISMFSSNIFSLLGAGANIPPCIMNFGTLYEWAKRGGKSIDIDILGVSVSFQDSEEDLVYLKDEKIELRLSQTSSGMQSLIPMWVVLNQYFQKKRNPLLVIEEPELNLYPSTQQKFIEWLMGQMLNSKSSLVITTHSPYILAAIDNLVQAKEVLKRGGSEEYLRELIPSAGWIDFDEVSSYFFPANGEVEEIRDEELKLIGAEYIDTASNEMGDIFDRLYQM